MFLRNIRGKSALRGIFIPLFSIAVSGFTTGCVMDGQLGGEPSLLSAGLGESQTRPVDKIHKVRAGETVFSISKSYKASPEEIAAHNGLKAPYLIHVGDALKIPEVDKPMLAGQRYYHEGDFALAEEQFRRAVEFAPKDAEGWLGLAASYDRMRRFDLSERAYKQAVKLAGRTPEVLNNLGYSYMLQGDFQAAQKQFHEALEQDPDNPVIRNNLQLLRASIAKSGGRRHG